jgi:hypothetical protein
MSLSKTNENGFNCIVKLLPSTLKKEYDCKQNKKKNEREGRHHGSYICNRIIFF